MNEIVMFLESKPLLLVSLCALTGYLTGSISFARIVYFLLPKAKKLSFILNQLQILTKHLIRILSVHLLLTKESGQNTDV